MTYTVKHIQKGLLVPEDLKVSRAMKKAIVSAAIAVSACLPISAAVGPRSFDDAIGVAVEKGHPRLFAGADGFAGIKPAAKKGSLRELALKRVLGGYRVRHGYHSKLPQ